MPYSRLLLPNALERLAQDIKDYQEGLRPDAEELAGAPLLDDWRLGKRIAIALHGTTYDHPVLPGPRNVATSELYFLDAEGQWARTFNRLYRLGTPRAERFN
jgi:hypothetical protein